MKKFKNFILDVDGVFTDGKFHYTSEGKAFKTFGDADSDALSLIKKYLHIEMVTGDKRGFPISKKRIQDDMGYELNLVSTFQRKEWISKKFDLSETIYMGDGIYDVLVFDSIGFGISPSNAFFNTKIQADFVTNAKGGEGAVAEACVYILEKILKLNFNQILREPISESGIWSKVIPNS
jgi:3-deoxy-D-manno-octulosonate 8-phosphate phosphatase (KDO 8-P phosphatase)